MKVNIFNLAIFGVFYGGESHFIWNVSNYKKNKELLFHNFLYQVEKIQYHPGTLIIHFYVKLNIIYLSFSFLKIFHPADLHNLYISLQHVENLQINESRSNISIMSFISNSRSFAL